MDCYEFSEVFEKVSRSIVGVFNVDELQKRIFDLSQDIFKVQACSLFLFDEEFRVLKVSASTGYSEEYNETSEITFKPNMPIVENPMHENEKIGITGWIAATGRPVRCNSFEELQRHPHWRGVNDRREIQKDKEVHNFYGVPLKVPNNKVIGVFKVKNRRDQGAYEPLTDEDVHLFDILASHIAIAIANAQKMEEIKRNRIQLETITNALQSVVSSLSEELPMQHLFDEIVETTAKVLTAEACVLFLKDEGRDVLIERAGVGYVAHLIGIAEYPLIPIEELSDNPIEKDKVGLTAWIAITGQPFLARDNKELKSHKHWRGRYDPEHYPSGSGIQCNSFLGVPLIVADKVVGVLKVENKKVDNRYVPFTRQDQKVFTTLSRSIAIAVGKVREQRLKQEQAITDVTFRLSEALAGRFDFVPLLQEIVRVGKGIFNAEACVIFLRDPDNPNSLVETKGEGYVKHLENIARYELIPREQLVKRPIKIEERVGLTAWIAITGQPFLASDNEQLKGHPHWRGRYDYEHYKSGSGKQCNSFLGLPLFVGEEILGVIKVENKKDGEKYVPFDERDKQLFQLLANNAAIAIRNARDFQLMQETEQLASIGRSAAAMAHRMRTPLQNIQITAELLFENLKSGGTKQNYSDINDILKSVAQMDNAIERVREAVKPLRPKLEQHDIQVIVEESFTHNPYYAKQFQERRILAQILGLEKVINPTIVCDLNLVKEAISNLVDNALESIGTNGTITIKIAELKDGFCIEVQDDGNGVNRKYIKLFEPFNTTKKDGLGLGLFIVRRNIEAHKGTSVCIDIDKGTCFRLEIPQPNIVRGKIK